ncbi:type II CAAX endopeptidase family protein [Nonomuraea sp. NPDC046802]|uniref:CPBP family intramembrane glutamic endopeptidase n=1 Tax=Nonomuraea sp. NPDC046802 TaxID=3154919 RepID=UPI00340921EF
MTDVTAPVEYHRTLSGDHRRIGRGILAIVLLIGGSQAFAIILTTGAALIDAAIGTPERAGFTPLTYAAGMASVALLLPWSVLIQRWLYEVPARSLSSVTSRFRWEIVGRSLVLLGPAFVIILVIQYWEPLPQTTWAHLDVVWLLAIALLLAPLQAAGEEYGFRGLIFRVAGSWSRDPRIGLILGIAVSSTLFAAIHYSTSGWLNLWYLVFAVGTALITWRTGGLETAVMMHALYNTLSFVFDAALSVDPSVATDRTEGAVTIAVLTPSIVVIAATVVVLVATRRTGPALTPGAPTPKPAETP